MEAALPIRLDKDAKKRLQDVARTLGISVSTLIRILITSFVDEFERSGGNCVMPPRWQTYPLTDKTPKERGKNGSINTLGPDSAKRDSGI